jgi:peptidoglycan hydrolase CwlO-like protein
MIVVQKMNERDNLLETINQLIRTCDSQEEEIKELRQTIRDTQADLKFAMEGIRFYQRVLRAVTTDVHNRYHSEIRDKEKI